MLTNAGGIHGQRDTHGSKEPTFHLWECDISEEVYRSLRPVDSINMASREACYLKKLFHVISLTVKVQGNPLMIWE